MFNPPSLQYTKCRKLINPCLWSNNFMLDLNTGTCNMQTPHKNTTFMHLNAFLACKLINKIALATMDRFDMTNLSIVSIWQEFNRRKWSAYGIIWLYCGSTDKELSQFYVTSYRRDFLDKELVFICLKSKNCNEQAVILEEFGLS